MAALAQKKGNMFAALADQEDEQPVQQQKQQKQQPKPQ